MNAFQIRLHKFGFCKIYVFHQINPSKSPFSKNARYHSYVEQMHDVYYFEKRFPVFAIIGKTVHHMLNILFRY